ncbi:MAG: hypothetical protein Q8K51_10810, partial [Nitrospirota bacterium]|nr:hypothetical protein [Nitrospirota bacterium]
MMFEPFRIATKEHWWDAIISMLFTLFGSLLPLWASYILLKVLASKFSFTDFIDHGEFALYSAALLSPALYIIGKDRTPAGFPYRIFFILILPMGLLFATLVFSGVVFATVTQNQPLNLNKEFLRNSTVILLILSVLFPFLINVLDNIRREPDMRTIKAHEMKKLEDQFDET